MPIGLRGFQKGNTYGHPREKGYKHLEETKRKISEAQMGDKNHMFGKHISYKWMKENGITFEGRHHSESSKEKSRQSKLGEKNPMWKGDSILLTSGLHRWVSKRIPRPKWCTRCNERPALDLANKGIYDRNLENWEWLCRHCHMMSDGRMNNLKQYRRIR